MISLSESLRIGGTVGTAQAKNRPELRQRDVLYTWRSERYTRREIIEVERGNSDFLI